MNINQSTNQIFNSVYKRLKPYHSLIENHTAIIAFSGGKDSILLFHFYSYLYSDNKCPEPILFHLDHSIRDNFLQENDIKAEMKFLSKNAIVKKKTFLNYLSD